MRRGFGQVSKLRSGRYQARWRFDGKYYTARVVDDENHDLGSLTFTTEKKASDYLTWIHREIEAGRWKPPGKAPKVHSGTTFRPYAETWLANKRTRRGLPLKPRTREHYQDLLNRLICPVLGELTLPEVADQDTFESWYYDLDAANRVQNAHAYDLVTEILRTAQTRRPEPLIQQVPTIKGASVAKKSKRTIRVLTDSELDELIEIMPSRYHVMMKVAAWCMLRFGELTALRKKHIETHHKCGRLPGAYTRGECVRAGCWGWIYVERGVTRTKGQWHEDTPKSGEGDGVPIVPHILPDIENHIMDLKRDELLFSAATHGGYMAKSTLHTVFNTAKKKIDRVDIRPHDMRHIGGTRAAEQGASIPELMRLMRHMTAEAAQLYFQVAEGRLQENAAKRSAQYLSGLG